MTYIVIDHKIGSGTTDYLHVAQAIADTLQEEMLLRRRYNGEWIVLSLDNTRLTDGVWSHVATIRPVPRHFEQASSQKEDPEMRNKIEDLKAQWLADACWYIEETEGFEEHRKQLLAFRLATEESWRDAEANTICGKALELEISLPLARYIINLNQRLLDMGASILDLEQARLDPPSPHKRP